MLIASEFRSRAARDPWSMGISTLAVSWSLFQIASVTVLVLDTLTLRSVHVMFLLSMVFLSCPAFPRAHVRKRRPSVLDVLWMGAGLFAFGYLCANHTAMALRGGYSQPMDTMVAGVGLAVCFELARRAAGSLVWLAALFFAYNFAGPWLPGVFGHGGFSWTRVTDALFWSSQGVLGVGVGVGATYIFLFILFGEFLKKSGFSEFINDLALTLVGRSAGGPAKVAVLASAVMGMINGSALANVATTGSVTIPLMQRAGYRAEFAAAVEAVASTGGQFTPPIMGAVGFLMAEFLGVSYTTVMLAAAIPAFLYYLTLLMAVHFEARKLGLRGMRVEHIPAALTVLRSRGHLLIPLLVLLALLYADFTPLYAATASMGVTVAASWLSPATRMSLADVLDTLDKGARGAMTVCAACVIIGVIIGTVALTGLGLTFGYAVLRHVQPGQMYLAGVLVMALSVVLGMGVPGVAAYVIVAAVAVPVLIKVGVVPLAAHMFCLMYACLSNITPPVAMSAYVAAGIAHADSTRTALLAMKLGLSGFLIPFFFLDNSMLLYAADHSFLRTLWAVASASLGVTALAAGLEGWLLGPCTWPVRCMLLAAALLGIDPNLSTDAAGLVLFAASLFWSRRASRS